MSKKAPGGTSHWKVKFTRSGMEPPMPFGKTSMIVCAANRDEAKSMVPASPGYPCTASATTDKVTFPHRCRCEANPDAVAPKSKAQLDAEIDQMLGRQTPNPYVPKYGNESGDFERGLEYGADAAQNEIGVSGRRGARETLAGLRKGARTEFDLGQVIAYARALGEA